MNIAEKETLRHLLSELGFCIQHQVSFQREGIAAEELSQVSEITASDTIYSIDRYSEEALLNWFSKEWPEDFPVELVAEGLEEQGQVVFPEGIELNDTRYKLIIDPIDGTRELMFDKRSAWALAGVAEQKFENNRLSDIEVAMMTELPVLKQRLADQVSGYRGCGRKGLVALRRNLDTGNRQSFVLPFNSATTLEHGVAAFVKFFPEGKELMTRLETDLWKRLDVFGKHKSPVIFDDQYISTGGQMYGLMAGHYRLFGDIRPEVLGSIGLGETLCCHPYDVAAGLLLEEAGCLYESPRGEAVDAPLDTVTPVSWIAYANAELAELIRPHLSQLMADYFDA